MAGVKFVVGIRIPRFFSRIWEKNKKLDKWVEENQGELALIMVAMASILLAGIVVMRLATNVQ